MREEGGGREKGEMREEGGKEEKGRGVGEG